MAPRLPLETPILVVDDSKAIRALMESYLKGLGYTRVSSADTVARALDVFHKEQSEIVFLDVLLGSEDGGDFALRAFDERPLTTVVLMTALASNDDEVTKLVAQGARHLLPKPIQLSALRLVLERLAAGRAEEAELQPEPPAPETAGYL